MEYKLILLDGRFSHFSKTKMSTNSRAFSTPTRLIAFAEEMTHLVKTNRPETITSGLFRVDIMTYKGEMVVNEFESLEAVYSPQKGINEACKEEDVNNFLETYWNIMLRERVLEPEQTSYYGEDEEMFI